MSVPLLIAHRGAPYVLPENTLESCRYAVELLGYRVLEIDVCLSRDGVPFLWHDAHPNALYALWRESGLRGDGLFAPRVPLPGTRLRKPVGRLDFETIKEHFGYHCIVRMPRRNATEHAVACAIPTLAEFFDWMSRTTQLEHVFLDIKLTDPNRATELVEAVTVALQSTSEALYERITLLSMDKAFLEALAAAKQRTNSALRLGYTLELRLQSVVSPGKCRPDALANKLGLNVITAGSAVWRIPFLKSIFRKIVTAQVARLDAWRTTNPSSAPSFYVWTINHPVMIAEFAQLGIDGIVTDNIPKHDFDSVAIVPTTI